MASDAKYNSFQMAHFSTIVSGDLTVCYGLDGPFISDIYPFSSGEFSIC